MSIPQSYKAAVIEGQTSVLKDVSFPKDASYVDNYLFIKVKATAGNPTDWKHIAFGLGPQGSIVGCDAAGEVVSIGKNVSDKNFKVGDSVFSFVHGSSVLNPTNGSFAEYCFVDPELTYNIGPLKVAGTDIPSGKVTTYEGGASLNVSVATAGLMFNHHLQLSPGVTKTGSALLVWGGATGVGAMIIQIAKLYGSFTKIIAVASKKHESVLKSFGADFVVDYHDSNAIEQIKSIDSNIKFAIECIGLPEVLAQVNKAVSSTEETKIMVVMPLTKENIPKEEQKSNVTVELALLYSATGLEVPFGPKTIPAQPKMKEATSEFIKWSTPYVKDGSIKHLPIKLIPGGLSSVNQMLDDIKNGRNSFEKLVIDV